MVHLVCCQTNLLFSDILLLYCYINLRSLIICCLLPKDIHFSFAISLSNPAFSVSLSFVSELLCGEPLQAFVILSISPVASAIF